MIQLGSTSLAQGESIEVMPTPGMTVPLHPSVVWGIFVEASGSGREPETNVGGEARREKRRMFR